MTETKAPAKRSAAKRGATKAEPTTAEAPVRSLRLHHLKPVPGSNKAKTRVGRGEASKGKTAGRGTKGTKARKTVPARFEGGQTPLHMRLPKLKGFANPFRVSYEIINLDRLAELFPKGGPVGPAELVAAGIARSKDKIKVLGSGELGGVVLNVTAHKFSGSAREKIAAAGGSATQL